MLTAVRGRRGMAVAPHALAAQSALDVLREGGNAIEAMIAAAATIAVVYPHMNSIGGDSFWLMYTPGHAPGAIDACGAAAAQASIDWYRERGVEAAIPFRGGLAANTVAGTVAGWGAAYALSREDLPGAGILMIFVIILVHELGHLLAAKWARMPASVFSIGFGPRLWSFRWGETEYRIGAIPLGGYVKIAGMIDESVDTEFVDQEPQPDEFRSKPVWQRMIIISAGVVMNLIFAVIFATFAFRQGVPYTPCEVGGVVPIRFAMVVVCRNG